MIHFKGKSYAAVTLKEAARRRGLMLTDDVNEAKLIFVSEDTPTDEAGNRDLSVIEALIITCPDHVTIVVTSQVTPGFMRQIRKNNRNLGPIYHQAETLRIEDGIQRAMYPEMFIVGSYLSNAPLMEEYEQYLEVFECPVYQMNYEEAEFCKIAINATLISQVETTNMLSAMAEIVGANWGRISQALRHDSRIGKYAYLTPGRWQNSKHLLRDYVTLNDIWEKRYIPMHKLTEAWK